MNNVFTPDRYKRNWSVKETDEEKELDICLSKTMKDPSHQYELTRLFLKVYVGDVKDDSDYYDSD